MRQVAQHESRAMHLMGVARYQAGEHPEDIDNQFFDYLTARGWTEGEAARAATSATQRVLADVDGASDDTATLDN